MAFAVVVLGGLGALGAFWVFQGLTHFGQKPGEPVGSGFTAVLVMGSVLLLADAVLIGWASAGFSQRVGLFQLGFVSSSLFGTQVVRWEDIAAIHQRSVAYSVDFVPVASFQSFTVYRKEGKPVQLSSNLKAVGVLGQAILRETYRILFPRLWEQIDRDQEVAFGPLSASRLGLNYGGRGLSWIELERVQFANGQLRLMLANGRVWARIPVKRVANLLVLLGVINRLQAQNLPPA
jgi:hypothetical protein